MNDRPTPETDSEHLKFRMGGFTLDFCRKLERERDEALSQIYQAEGRAERFCQERDESREELEHIAEAAQAVVDRWELPAWKDAEPTAAVIYRLRDALGNATTRNRN